MLSIGKVSKSCEVMRESCIHFLVVMLSMIGVMVNWRQRWIRGRRCRKVHLDVFIFNFQSLLSLVTLFLYNCTGKSQLTKLSLIILTSKLIMQERIDLRKYVIDWLCIERNNRVDFNPNNECKSITLKKWQVHIWHQPRDKSTNVSGRLLRLACCWDPIPVTLCNQLWRIF